MEFLSKHDNNVFANRRPEAGLEPYENFHPSKKGLIQESIISGL